MEQKRGLVLRLSVLIFTFLFLQKASFAQTSKDSLPVGVKPGSQRQLHELHVNAGRKQRYKNRNNPAVSLIEQVIARKGANRMQHADYLAYTRLERLQVTLHQLPARILKSRLFKPYRFLLDSNSSEPGVFFPAYQSEKRTDIYFRRNPAKTVSILRAQKMVSLNEYIDGPGLDTYLNRLYADVDIYENNIFILTNQFLSPVADHAPDYYKYFITDTVIDRSQKFIVLSFVPRVKGSLLFEGEMQISTDGQYAIRSIKLRLGQQINLNFVQAMELSQKFEKQQEGRYFLTESTLKADYDVYHLKPVVTGQRSVFFSNYRLNQPQPAIFYDGPESRNAPDFLSAKIPGPGDSVLVGESKIYKKADSLGKMHQVRRLTGVLKFLTGGFFPFGPLELGPMPAFYSYNSLQGNYVGVGARTTEQFNRSVYLDLQEGYGVRDKKTSSDVALFYAFNHQSVHTFPNDYLRLSYVNQAGRPGDDRQSGQPVDILTAFQRNANNLFLYHKEFSLNYVRDFPRHLSASFGLRTLEQTAAGELIFERQSKPGHPIQAAIHTSELSASLRYAPNEKFFQGVFRRYTIPNRYPVLSFSVQTALRGLAGGDYNFTRLEAGVSRRFYLSQLGTADVVFKTEYLAGQVPFPLLHILSANQSYEYDANAFNNMNFLEFLSDHDVRLDITHSLNGFLLDRIPLLRALKLREILSLKIIEGGTRSENSPTLHANLLAFPQDAAGLPLAYSLDRRPYVEVGAGVANIFKVLKVYVIRRLTYLDHPGTSSYSLRFNFAPDF